MGTVHQFPHWKNLPKGLRLVEEPKLEPVPLITTQVQMPNERLWELMTAEQRGEDVREELDALCAKLEAEYEPGPEAA